MANLYTDSTVGDIVKVDSTVGGYYEMMVIYKKAPNEVWLVDKAGQGNGKWGQRGTICKAFGDSLAKSVRDSVTKTRLLEAPELEIPSCLPYFLSSYRIKSLIKDGSWWWTNTEKDANYARIISNGGTSIIADKTKEYEIHPMIILNGSQDIEGVTLPPKKITVPTLSKSSFPYDEIPCEPEIDYKGNENNIATSKSYGGKQSAVGTYTITFTIKDTTKYNWSNNPKGATAAATLTWEIKAPAVTPITTVPSPNKTLTYNGSEQTMTFDGYDPEKMTISGNTGTNAGAYTAIITPKSGYSWSDGTTGGKSVSWKIVKKSVDIPVASGSTTHYYDATPYFPNINYGTEDNPKWYTITEDKTALSDVGDYKVTFVLKDKNNCQWENNTITDKFISWRIIKRTITIPEISPLSFVYNGAEQSPRISIKSGEEKYITISGTTAAIDVNLDGYVFKLSLSDPLGCVWSDGSTEPRKLTWYITPKRIDVIPSQKGTLIYNESSQSPEWNDFDPAELSVGGTVSGINAGGYPAVFTPKPGHCWGDGSVAPIEVEWVIHRSPTAVPPVIGDNVFQYNGRAQSPTWVFFDAERTEIISGGSGVNAHKYEAVVRPVTNYCWEDGSLDGVPYEWEITRKPISADPTYTGDLVFEYNRKMISPKWVNYPQDYVGGKGLSAMSAGEYTAEFTVDGNHCWTDGTYSPIEIKWIITYDLSRLYPDDIIGAITDNIHDKIWKLGDCVPIMLDGVVGGVRFKKAWFYAYIIGFNHNMGVEGGGWSIHFQFAKFSKNDKEVAFTDKNYSKSGAGKGFCMNTTDTAKGGWRDSYMRNTICRQFYEALPKVWRDAIISCPKYTENAENSVTMTKDKIIPNVPVPSDMFKTSMSLDLTFKNSDGEKVQPQKPVTVKIPVPERFKDSSTIYVYYIGDDNKVEKIEVEVRTLDEVEYVVFEANKFSTYVLTDVEIKDSSDTSGTTSSGTSTPTTSTPTTSEPTSSGTSDPNTSKPSTDDSTSSGSGETSAPTSTDNTSSTSTPISGDVSQGVTSGENVPKAEIKTPDGTLAEAVLTAEELEHYKNGAALSVDLAVTAVEGSVSSFDRQLVEKALSKFEYKPGRYLDLQLFKTLDNGNKTQITETNTPITVSVEIPEALRAAGREYVIIRVHDGEADVLKDYDDNVNTITIRTDKFSVYALAYSESSANVDNSQNGENNPYTGSNSHSEIYLTVGIVSLIVFVILCLFTGKNGMTEEQKEHKFAKLIAWGKRGGRIRAAVALTVIFLLLSFYYGIGMKTSEN